MVQYIVIGCVYAYRLLTYMFSSTKIHIHVYFTCTGALCTCTGALCTCIGAMCTCTCTVDCK